MGLKRVSVEIDHVLAEVCKSATGIQSLNSLISHALHELLRRQNGLDLPTLNGRTDQDGESFSRPRLLQE
jgi:hypothetical protein